MLMVFELVRDPAYSIAACGSRVLCLQVRPTARERHRHTMLPGRRHIVAIESANPVLQIR